MSKDRKYSEKEIAAIFKYAASAQELAGEPSNAEEGLSLAELQKIGEGSGIQAEFIARAAAALDGGQTGIIQELAFGKPVALKKTIALKEKMSDDQWERIVVDMREVFGTHGHLSQEGSFRKWVGHDVQVNVEPDNTTGYRVRIEAGEQRRGAIDLALGMGVIFFLMSMIFWFQAFFLDRMIPAIVGPGIMMLIASLAPMFLLARLPKLARRRISQIETISARILERTKLTDPAVEKEVGQLADAVAEPQGPQLSIDDSLETPLTENRNAGRNPRLRS
ncbi:MAG: hypothetical protein AAF385_10115 [Pseudomonadota bacterium]